MLSLNTSRKHHVSLWNATRYITDERFYGGSRASMFMQEHHSVNVFKGQIARVSAVNPVPVQELRPPPVLALIFRPSLRPSFHLCACTRVRRACGRAVGSDEARKAVAGSHDNRIYDIVFASVSGQHAVSLERVERAFKLPLRI